MKHNPKPCPQCGSRHEWLNITIDNRTLRRIADSSRGHLLRAFGGAWGFKREVIDGHAAEIDRIEIHDRATGQTFRTTFETWQRKAILQNLGYGPQSILRVSDFDDDTPGPSAAPASVDQVQPILIQSKEITGATYTPARSKRPRIYKTRRTFRTWENT